MKGLLVALVVIGLALVASLAAAQTPPVVHTPQIHRTVCALAESIASKLGGAKLTHESAQQTCQTLSPTMSAADHAEFMRCCTVRLESGPPPTNAGSKEK